MKKIQIYLSLVVFSALLPVVLWGVVGGPSGKFISKAGQEETLKIWFEPKEIKTSVGQEVKLQVIARYENPNKVIPKLEFFLNTDENINLLPGNLVYKNTFTGEIVAGETVFKSTSAGNYQISVAPSSVNTGLVDLDVITFPANIIVSSE